MIMNIVILVMIIIKRLSETMSHDHDIVDDHDHDHDHDEGVDRISELPEPIIHHIMEFLPIYGKDTTRISVLSKKFFSCWCSFPAIDFNFLPKEPITLTNKSTKSVLKSVRYCVNQRRLNKNTHPLKRLTFIAPLHGGWEPEPDGNTSVVDLINFAIDNQVQELDLFAAYYLIPSKPRTFIMKLLKLGDLDPWTQRVRLSNRWVTASCLPELVFSAKSITILRLCGFKFVETNSDHVTFNFPLIKIFSLLNCCGITSIMLHGGKQLKEVDLKFCHGLDKIHIDGPTTLELLCYGGEPYCEIDIASSCKRVKVLQLTNIQNTDDKMVTSNFSRIVEKLMFDCCFLPVKTRWYLESLKVLELIDSYCKVEFEAPNLERFNFYSGSLMRDIPLVISSNRFEGKLNCFYHGLSSDYFVMKRFSQSISCFTDCQILTLGCHSTEELIFASDIRAIVLHPPLHGIKHLNITFSKLHDMVELIDSLLWFVPHPNTISIIDVHHPHAVKTIVFNYNEYVRCGYMSNRKCHWQHYLKGVVLVKFKDVEERTRLQTYFSTTYKISSRLIQ